MSYSETPKILQKRTNSQRSTQEEEDFTWGEEAIPAFLTRTSSILVKLPKQVHRDLMQAYRSKDGSEACEVGQLIHNFETGRTSIEIQSSNKTHLLDIFAVENLEDSTLTKGEKVAVVESGKAINGTSLRVQT